MKRRLRWRRERNDGAAYARLHTDGPAIEIYRSDMRTTPKEQLRTDLLAPLR